MTSSSFIVESFNSSYLSSCEWQYMLEDLPNELLSLILGYLPLPDLANTRLVCSRLQKLVDATGSRQLWAQATLEGSCLWLTQENKKLLHRAAEHGNVEALVMLAVAHLYSEGVPEGTGKGTYEATNGIKATEYLIRAEQLTPHTPPFSWVLFRPPWAANSMCCKACVCRRMENYCSNHSQDSTTGLHYCIGKVLGFRDDGSEGEAALEWFERGAQSGCIHSKLEQWRKTHRQQLLSESLEPLRELRTIVSHAHFSSSLLSAQLELASAYARGYYGGLSETEALRFMREVFREAKNVLWERVYQLQENMTRNVRYILIDWIIEVAGMKLFSPQTVHLAVNIIDRYLLLRSLPRSKLQLLGITSLLLAARWSSEFILTVREASWLTEETYQYENVVRMMGGVVAAFKGEVRSETLTDYLDTMLELTQASGPTKNMAYYLSESMLLHTRFGRYSASHLAAACLLTARVLLGLEYPWPQRAVEGTGLTVTDLKRCCLAIYDECLTDKNVILDYRKVKLESVTNRYAGDTFGSISKHPLISYQEFKETLGMHPDSSLQLFTPSPHPCRHSSKHKKLLSFLSDSCYLTTSQSSPELDSDSSLSYSNSGSPHSNIDEDQLSSPLDESQSSIDVCFSPSELDGISSPYSSAHCQRSHVVNSSGSEFPQPFFGDNDGMIVSSSPSQSNHRKMSVSVFDHNEEIMDIEDTLFAQSSAASTNTVPLELRTLTSGLAAPTPHCTTSHHNISQPFCEEFKTFQSNMCKETVQSNKRMALQCVVNLPLHEEKLSKGLEDNSLTGASENAPSSLSYNRFS